MNSPYYIICHNACYIFTYGRLGELKKNIKNLHLVVAPPDGNMRVSAPVHLSDESSYKGNSVALNGNEAVLTVRKESTAKQREAFVNEWYRSLLKEKIEIYLPKWEKITGLYCDSWQTKYMTTRWGTCNTNTRKIWLNLQLAKKPMECLEYVILHELTHLKVRNHGKDFIAIMDQYMPYWRETKKLLNELKLDHMDEVEGYNAMHDITCD